MADKIGGYRRPTNITKISDTFQGHKNRTPPSQEPGTDYAVPYGTPVYAPEDGVVADIKVTNTYATGRYVTIDLNDGYRTRSLHLSKVLVAVGTKVKRGQQVAFSGASANGSDWGVGAHVHQTLWPEHRYTVGTGNKCIDFERFVGDDNDVVIPAALPISRKGVTTAPLNLRATPGGATLLTIPAGITLTLDAASGGWRKTTYGKRTGWVSAAYLEAKTQTTLVAVNLRKGPGTNFPIIKTLAKGTSVTVDHTVSSWASVRAGLSSGFVSREYIAGVV